ncbi:hypothetical protein HanRHA438_Chr09g0399941 [Helianthus annuus]|nr:hypothetical protein HanRHA438_Chr09g0399941 [Helianthus annuus]
MYGPKTFSPCQDATTFRSDQIISLGPCLQLEHTQLFPTTFYDSQWLSGYINVGGRSQV